MARSLWRSLLAGLGALSAAPCIDERNRRMAEAQAKGGCVPASRCDTGQFRLDFPEACYPTPEERERVINEIKAAEIEAAILEEIADEAEKAESNSPEAEARASSAASALEVERQALETAHSVYQAHIESAEERLARLRHVHAVAQRDRDNLIALRRGLGIA